MQHWQRRDPMLHPLQLRHQQDEQGALRPLQLHDEHLREVNKAVLLFTLERESNDLERIVMYHPGIL